MRLYLHQVVHPFQDEILLLIRHQIAPSFKKKVYPKALHEIDNESNIDRFNGVGTGPQARQDILSFILGETVDVRE